MLSKVTYQDQAKVRTCAANNSGRSPLAFHRLLRLVASALLGLTFLLAPYVIQYNQASCFKVELAAAYAKNGNNGNGNGNNGKGNSSNSATGPGQVPVAVKITVSSQFIEVVHSDGISERVEAGRFKMKDPLGRTIIDRVAKPGDIKRLKGL